MSLEGSIPQLGNHWAYNLERLCAADPSLATHQEFVTFKIVYCICGGLI